MKKEYAVNIKSVNSDSDWNTTDMADWSESYSDAMTAAKEAFEDSKVLEVIVSVWVDGEIVNTPLRMVQENGIINQYQGEKRLWA